MPVRAIRLTVPGFWDRFYTEQGAAVATVMRSEPFTQAIAFGDVIGEHLDFRSTRSIHVHSDDPRDIDSAFEEGVLAYIGVRTTSGNNGWIAVQRGVGTIPENHSLTAFAWAYQTEPGVPVRAGEVPGVGGVALFGLAGLAARRRRRLNRHDDRSRHRPGVAGVRAGLCGVLIERRRTRTTARGL